VRLRLLERVGSALRFSPEGRDVRVWVSGQPGADETEVVPGTIESIGPAGAVLRVREAAGEHHSVLAVPREPGWGFQALWFSFIAVDVFELGDEDERVAAAEPLGRWFIRLGSDG
jgi:hypothetical protein